MDYKVFLYICIRNQTQTPMEKKVFLVARRNGSGYEYFGIFSTHKLAEEEAEKHYGAFIFLLTIDQPTTF